MTLFNVANNIRWLASGPRCGFYEIKLPDRQPGSSIMPGKVNPVLCESLMQVAARVMGNDQTISVCGAAGGQFQLNIMMPVMADCTLESIRLMANAVNAFTAMCLVDMEANAEACEAAIERSLALVTALESDHRLRTSGRLGERSLQNRQDDPRALPREENPARRGVSQGSRSSKDDSAGWIASRRVYPGASVTIKFERCAGINPAARLPCKRQNYTIPPSAYRTDRPATRARW